MVIQNRASFEGCSVFTIIISHVVMRYSSSALDHFVERSHTGTMTFPSLLITDHTLPCSTFERPSKKSVIQSYKHGMTTSPWRLMQPYLPFCLTRANPSEKSPTSSFDVSPFAVLLDASKTFGERSHAFKLLIKQTIPLAIHKIATAMNFIYRNNNT